MELSKRVTIVTTILFSIFAVSALLFLFLNLFDGKIRVASSAGRALAQFIDENSKSILTVVTAGLVFFGCLALLFVFLYQRQKVKTLRQEVEDLGGKFTERELSNAALSTDNQNLRHQLREAQQASKRLDDSTNPFASSNATTENAPKKLMPDKTQEGLQLQLRSAQAKIQTLEAKIAELQEREPLEQNNPFSNNDDNDARDDTIKGLQQEKERLASQVTELNTNIASLTSDYEAAFTNNVRLSNMLKNASTADPPVEISQ